MEDSKAKKLLSAERRRVEGLLKAIDEAEVATGWPPTRKATCTTRPSP